MRIVCISDSHQKHDRLVIPACDVLVHAGDMTSTGTFTEVAAVAGWFRRLLDEGTVKNVVLTPGNHDWLFATDWDDAVKLFEDRVSILKDSEVTVDGVRFYGSPWQPEFYNWAFNLPRAGDELREHWKAIPAGVDVLVTHGPPGGILDISRDGEHVGCYLMRVEVLERVKPRIHVFGHIHGSAGVHEQDGIKFINASVLDERYQMSQKPVVVDF